MLQKEFEILLQLIKVEMENHSLYGECYQALKNDKVLLHDIGFFEKNKVTGNLKDKISIENLDIQNHNTIGIEILYKNLSSHLEETVRQFTITAYDCRYLIICSSGLEKLIGIAKKVDMNIDKDLKYQTELKKEGYPNKNIWVFETGVLTGSI
jgi:hypothetical protein